MSSASEELDARGGLSDICEVVVLGPSAQGWMVLWSELYGPLIFSLLVRVLLTTSAVLSHHGEVLTEALFNWVDETLSRSKTEPHMPAHIWLCSLLNIAFLPSSVEWNIHSRTSRNTNATNNKI